MKKLKRTRALVHAVLPYLIRPAWLIAKVVHMLRHAFSQSTRDARILLVCHNVVAADHLVPVAGLLRERTEYRLYVTNDHFPSQEITARKIRQTVNASYRPILACLFMDWDLIVFVNHPWGFGAWFAPFLRKLYINHGLHAGKINNPQGEDGVYGPHRTTRPYRGFLYDRMFAASSHERDAALVADPRLQNVIRVTGSLMADKVVQTSHRRREIRSRLGFQDSESVIHVISTWGTASLMATMGPALLGELVHMGRIRHVLLSLHPRLDKFGGVSASRKDILQRWASKGATVDVDNDRWRDFLAAADVAIADHSSLALYHIVLRKPAIFVPVESSAYIGDSSFDQASRNFPQLKSISELSSILLSVRAGHVGAGRLRIDQLVEHLGEAGERHLEEIDSLLRS